VVVRLVLAIVVALTVPVSQLQTISITTTCCCPDPAKCHCPDHKADHSKVPSIRACHKSSHETVAPQLPSFSPPEVAIAIAPPRAVAATITAPRSLHEAAISDEPYGPS
jgi:hypothetical protein